MLGVGKTRGMTFRALRSRPNTQPEPEPEPERYGVTSVWVLWLVKAPFIERLIFFRLECCSWKDSRLIRFESLRL